MAGVEGFPRNAAVAASASRYAEIAARPDLRHLAQSFIIPARTGKAFHLPASQIVRVTCSEGPQVADMIVFNADDRAEKFWSGRTRVIHGGHLKIGDHLWSVPPRVRPMLTLIADTLERPPHPFGARSHDLLCCRCDSRMYAIVYGRTGARNCNDNLAEAISEFGIGPEHVHDPFNIFMTTGLNNAGKPFILAVRCQEGRLRRASCRDPLFGGGLGMSWRFQRLTESAVDDRDFFTGLNLGKIKHKTALQ
jgi:uncharacterized protein YcgI (DUF1989 family)